MEEQPNQHREAAKPAPIDPGNLDSGSTAPPPPAPASNQADPYSHAGPSPSETDNAANRTSDPPLMPWHCGAKGKRTGKPCRAPAMANGRCQMHGGKSLGGIASPTFKHGRYSRSLTMSLPERFRERFEAAMADPELLSLRQYVALGDLKVREAVEKLQASDAGDYRSRLLKFWEQFTRANAERIDPDDPHAAAARAAKAAKITDALNAIGQAIRDGAAEEEAWLEVFGAIKERVSITAQEHKRLVDLEQILTVEQATALVVALYRAASRIIKDPKVLQQLGTEIDREAAFASRSIRLAPPAVGL